MQALPPALAAMPVCLNIAQSRCLRRWADVILPCSLLGYVDIHAHVLPTIDDGPPDLAGAIAMVRAAADSGISVVAATPHVRYDFPGVRVEELACRVKRLREALGRAEIPVTLVGGAEVSLPWATEASDEDLVLASYCQRGTDLLIETPSDAGFALDRLLFWIRSRGFRVILAHPERCIEFQTDLRPVRELVDQGVLLQINAESLVGTSRRSKVRRLAEQLCTEGLAHVLASDGHRSSMWRPVTRLAEGADAAASLLGPERAEWMVSAAPQAIVDGSDLPEAPPTSGRRRMHWFGH